VKDWLIWALIQFVYTTRNQPITINSSTLSKKKNKEKTRKKRKFENLACAGVYVRVPNNNNDKKKKRPKKEF